MLDYNCPAFDGVLLFFKIHWENKLLSVAGHTKDPSEAIQGVLSLF